MLRRLPLLWIVLAAAGAALGATEKQALLVGLGDYPHPAVRDLQAPPHDLELMEALLTSQYGFTPGEITVRRDGQATRAAVLQHLHGLGRALRAQRRRLQHFLFYFSGHGGQVFDVHHDEPTDFEDEVLVLADWDGQPGHLDRGGLLDDELYAALQEIPAQRRWVVLDCCYAGGGARPLAVEESDEGEVKAVVAGGSGGGLGDRPFPAVGGAKGGGPPGLLLDAPAPGMLCLAASRSGEPVRELRRLPGGPRIPISPLTLSLYQRLMRQPARPLGPLWGEVVEDHRRWKLPQCPQLEAGLEEAGGAFLGGPAVWFPRPSVPVLGVVEERVTLGGGAALGLRPGDRLACYAPLDRQLHQPVGTVQVNAAALTQAEGRSLHPFHRIGLFCRAVVTHLRWPPAVPPPGPGPAKQAEPAPSPEGSPEEALPLATLIRCWEPLGDGGSLTVSADRPDGRYRLGEAVRLTLQAPSPRYWLVVSVEPGEVVGLLHPNPWQPGKEPSAALRVLPPEAPVELVAPGPTGFWCVRAFASDHPFECEEGVLAPGGPDELPSVRDPAAFLAALRRFLGGEAGEEGLLSAAGWTTGSVTLEVGESSE